MASTLASEGSNGVGDSKGKLIGTHDGTFHCDEALAVYLLRQTEAYRNATVLRTRDEALLAKADVVVDVGGVYDASTQRFDHHQKGFEEYYSEQRKVTKLSSAGLVYRHYGMEVIRALLTRAQVPIPKEMDTVYLEIYNSFIEALDANDTGVNKYPGDAPALYRSSTDLPSRVSRLNAPWNVKENSARGNQELNFEKASNLAGGEFKEAVMACVEHWLPAREIVARMYAKASERGDGIMVMDEFVPWKSHLFELDTEKKMLYILYEDSAGRGWRIQCVPDAPGSFKSRKPLPEAWRGLRDDKLCEVAGIQGCVFVHAAGFIGGNKTYEGVTAMAEAALVAAGKQ